MTADQAKLTIIEGRRGGRVRFHCSKRCEPAEVEDRLLAALTPPVDARALRRRA